MGRESIALAFQEGNIAIRALFGDCMRGNSGKPVAFGKGAFLFNCSSETGEQGSLNLPFQRYPAIHILLVCLFIAFRDSDTTHTRMKEISIEF